MAGGIFLNTNETLMQFKEILGDENARVEQM